MLLYAGMALDLRPFMQRTPFVLQGNASLARAYRLFRTMGLHHLYVGPPKPQVIGLLTRKVCVSPSSTSCTLCATLSLLKTGFQLTATVHRFGQLQRDMPMHLRLASRC